MAFISKLYILLVQDKIGKFRVSEKLEIKAIRKFCGHKKTPRKRASATGWNRTNDTQIFSLLLYQLSYSGVMGV